MTQFDTWQAVIGTFICLNIIQFVIGSYVEPRLSGNVLAISPFVVLFAIFFWTFLWGLFGTFIGVPIALAIFDVLRTASVQPMAGRSARRPGANRDEPIKS